MSRTQRRDGHSQDTFLDREIRICSERALNKGPTFFLYPPVVRRYQTNQISLRLVSDHLYQVGQVLSLRGKLDDIAGDNVLDGDASQ